MRKNLRRPRGILETERHSKALPLKSRTQPFKKDILAYLKEEVFPQIEKAVQSINTIKCAVDYDFITDMPWYVSADVKMLMYENYITTTEPKELTGGKIWLELIINGERTGYKMMVTWNEDLLKIGIDERQLTLLATSTSWDHTNKNSIATYEFSPSGGKLGNERKALEEYREKLISALTDDLVSAIVSFGTKKGDIDKNYARTVAIRILKEYAKENDYYTNDGRAFLVGKAVVEYLRNGQL